MNFEFKEIPFDEIETIKPLWEGLNIHHEKLSKNFPDYYSEMNFEKRKNSLLNKSADIKFKVDVAIDLEKNDKVGYCISSVNNEGEGEIDSIFIKPDYRNHGIGEILMKRSLDWLDSYNAGTIKIQVASGNEEVFKFYEKYNFYPKYTMLFQKKNH